MRLTHLLHGQQGLPLEVVIPTVVGSICWVFVYVILLVQSPKSKFFEMPLIIVIGDVVWETLYGFVFPLDPSLNPMIQWGIRAWCILDYFNLALALKYAKNSIATPKVLFYLKPIVLGLALFWVAFFYSIADSGTGEVNISTHEDLVREATSAYLLNIVISLTYIFQYLRLYNQRVYSPSVAWLKMLGTGLTTVAVCFYRPFNELLIILGVLVFLADIAYIFLFLHVLPNHVEES
jgi:hypothetical protein